MNHKIKKQNIFYFLKSQGIVREIKNSTKILETTPNSFFTELNINGLNQSSIYWQFQTENSMLHKYKYFVVYEEIDNSLRSLNNDSSIVHIKMKNIIVL